MAHHGEIKMLTEVVGEGEVQVCLSNAHVHERITPAVVVSPSASVAAVGGGELGRRLLTAAATGDNHAVRELIAQGAPFVSDWLGVSPLHAAASSGHVEVVQSLVNAGMSRDVRTKVERSALHMAAANGHVPVLRTLLEAGAPADCRDMLRMTPLHWAAARGRLAAARELCRAGACPRAVSRFLHTPLQIALRNHPQHHQLHAVLRQREKEVAEAEAEAELYEEEQTADAPPPTAAPPQQPPEEKPAAAAALLRAHGITLIPEDEGSTVLTAIQSGRTVVLSDVGKIMLKESEKGTPEQKPQPDVKVVPSVCKAKPRSVKILLNKSHLGKLVATPPPSHVVRVPEQFLQSTDPEYLRRQLLAAHAGLARLKHQIKTLRSNT